MLCAWRMKNFMWLLQTLTKTHLFDLIIIPAFSNFFKILVSWPEEMVITYFYRWFAFKLRACIVWKAITMKCDRNWSCIPVYSWSHHDQRLTLCTREKESVWDDVHILLNLQDHIKLVITMLINMQFFGNALMSA